MSDMRTVDEIVEKIIDERYQVPSDPAIAAHLRDMVSEIVERALMLATGQPRAALNQWLFEFERRY